MARVRRENTRPELIVRSLLHRMGYRYQLHRKDLPGTPDIVFPSKRKVIFVHGCFWHQHEECSKATLPKTRADFWQEKLSANRIRDARVQDELRILGWDVYVVWECLTRDRAKLKQSLEQFLKG